MLRNDGKLSLKLPDLDKFEHVWDVELDLPWDAATRVIPGTQPPEVLDQALMDAISLKTIPTSAENRRILHCLPLPLHVSCGG